MPNCIIVMISS